MAKLMILAFKLFFNAKKALFFKKDSFLAAPAEFLTDLNIFFKDIISNLLAC